MLDNTDKIYFDALSAIKDLLHDMQDDGIEHAVYMVDCTVYLFLSHRHYARAWDLADEFNVIMKNYYLGEIF